MARIPMVTRTVTTTKATAVCVDVNNPTAVFEQEVVLPRTYESTVDAVKVAQKILPENFHVVTVKDFVVDEKLYAMTEEEFVNNEHVKILPPRTKKTGDSAEESEN